MATLYEAMMDHKRRIARRRKAHRVIKSVLQVAGAALVFLSMIAALELGLEVIFGLVDYGETIAVALKYIGAMALGVFFLML